MKSKPRICVACGTTYEYCPKCTKDADKPVWMVAFHTEECRKVYNITKGLESLSKHLYEKNIDPTKLFPVSLIFTKDGSFSVTENEATTYGRCMSFLVYSMERIITSNNQHMQLFAFIEELVHYYFQETNETKVKLTTFSVVQKIFPEITFEEVTSWGVNWS